MVTNTVTTSYLGYPIIITDRNVTVIAPDGRRVGHTTSVKQARLLIRGYRREGRRT